MQVSPLIKYLLALALVLAFDASAKPGAAISLRGPSSYQVEPHSSAQFNIEFALPAKAGNLQIITQTQGPIAVTTPERNQHLVLDGSTSRFIMPVNLESSEAGVAYLMFNVILTNDNGRKEARSLGVRVQVGAEVQQNKPQNIQSDETRIKEMPAQETIH